MVLSSVVYKVTKTIIYFLELPRNSITIVIIIIECNDIELVYNKK